MLEASHIVIKCANLWPTEGDSNPLAENEVKRKVLRFDRYKGRKCTT